MEWDREYWQQHPRPAHDYHDDNNRPYDRHGAFIEDPVRLLNQILECGVADSSTDGGRGLSRCMVVLGRSGTGKTTGINAIRAGLEEGTDSVMAPTGKAAMVIGGSTIFNNRNGLCLPTKRCTVQGSSPETNAYLNYGNAGNKDCIH